MRRRRSNRLLLRNRPKRHRLPRTGPRSPRGRCLQRRIRAPARRPTATGRTPAARLPTARPHLVATSHRAPNLIRALARSGRERLDNGVEWVEVTGKTVDEATERALDQLGVALGDAELIVVSEPKTGLFGRVREEARVRARVRPVGARPKRERSRRSKPSRPGGQRSSTGSGGRSSGNGGRGRTAGPAETAGARMRLETPESRVNEVIPRGGPQRTPMPRMEPVRHRATAKETVRAAVEETARPGLARAGRPDAGGTAAGRAESGRPTKGPRGHEWIGAGEAACAGVC